MKKIITASLVASLALTGVAGASSLSAQLNSLEAELAEVKKQLAKQNTKINEVRAHDAGDNIKWGVDLRTGVDNINYDIANGASAGNDALMSLRLWLNMAYAPDSHNIFKGRLSMNKAFGADFGYPGRAHGLGQMFDWTGNAALADNNLKVSEAYWLYLGDTAFGLDMPWTFSIGRRPSTSGFIGNLREDDPASSPLAHVINVEFDGLSTKLDFSNITGVPGLSFKLCMGRGSSSATPLFETATPYADDALENIDMAGFIFEPYNDGQYIVKTTWFKAWDLPGMDPIPEISGNPMNPSLAMTPSAFNQYGDMQGAAISVLVDGITEDGYFADAKIFGSFAWSKSEPDVGSAMLGSTDSETGTSYWFGAQLPVTEKGMVGLEFNHGSQYWRPFTYAEDTMIGSKIAARGDAWEAYFTYQLTDALSAQVRYTDITYDYAGSQGFFGNFSGNAMKIDDMKAGASAFTAMGGTIDQDGAHNLGVVTGALMGQGMDMQTAQQTAGEMAGAAIFAANTVEAAQDFRFYLRYRF
ncbi:DUF3373 family protein [Sulfurovum sp. CS9]|uniref:DUF3373 family protein n=1 Tax=Sulfurovum sp. CS9 TaxID=3391146 RepID=UPI0039E91626